MGLSLSLLHNSMRTESDVFLEDCGQPASSLTRETLGGWHLLYHKLQYFISDTLKLIHFINQEL